MNALSLDGLVGRVPLVARAALAILILCAIILAMVLDRASVLRSGATVRLATLPVDPRDLFRGDYVILRYEISSLNLTRLGAPRDGFRAGDKVLVGLRPRADGVAEAARIAREGEARDAALVWIEGRIASLNDCFARAGVAADCAAGDRMARLTYGLESYFVPQGEGRGIERTAASRVQVLAAVTRPDARPSRRC